MKGNRGMLLSLDIAFTNIGWSVIHGGKIVDMGVIHSEKSGKKNVRVSDERADMCATMVGCLMDLIFKHKVSGVIGELPSGSQNATAANLLGWAGSMVVTTCRVLNLPAEWVNQNDVKIAVMGKRNATKHEIMDRVAKEYGWERTEKIIRISTGKRAGKTSSRVMYHTPSGKFPGGKFEHIADSIGVYWASRDRNLCRLYG